MDNHSLKKKFLKSNEEMCEVMEDYGLGKKKFNFEMVKYFLSKWTDGRRQRWTDGRRQRRRQ